MKIPDYLVEACHHVLEVARKEKGMTKTELAEKTGINDSYFRACTYRKRNISVGVLWRIAEALGVPVDSLVVKIIERRNFLQNAGPLVNGETANPPEKTEQTALHK